MGAANLPRRDATEPTATLLHEPVTWMMLVVTLAVILCVVGARKFAN